jgi:hypothetical protein
MHYIRLHSDKGGDTHFSEVELALDEADYRPPACVVAIASID